MGFALKDERWHEQMQPQQGGASKKIAATGQQSRKDHVERSQDAKV
jgi:hypothetical protein